MVTKMANMALASLMSMTPAVNAEYFIAADGNPIWYRSIGHGETTIIFIHGGLYDSSSSWPNFILRTLANEYRLLQFDMRGHGFTWRHSPESYGFSLAQVAQDLHMLINNEAGNNIVLVGWSTGAYVAYEYLETFGYNDIASLVVIDMPPRFVNDQEWELGFGTLEEISALIQAAQANDFAVRSQFTQSVLSPLLPIGNTKGKKLLRHGTLPTLQTVGELLTELSAADYRHLVPTLDIPVLYMYGTESELFPNDAAEWMGEAGAEVRRCYGAGHALQLQRHGAFFRYLEHFLMLNVGDVK